MKLSANTINVLRNFSSINANILIKQGKKLSTMAVAKNIMAEVEVEEDFPNDVGIFNLSEFLGVISLMDSPELTFDSKSMLIKEGTSKIRYTYSNPDILVYPQKSITMPSSEIKFNVTSAQLVQLQKAASALSVQDVCIVGNGKKIVALVTDKKNDSSNQYTIDLDTKSNIEFSANFKIDNFKFVSDNYEVEISSKKISKFVGLGMKVTYYVALEDDSTF